MWDPFRDVDRFLSGLDRAIGNAGGHHNLFGRGTQWHVNTNVAETDTHYTVEVDLPGVNKENVQVRIEDDVSNRLCISGNRARPAYLATLLAENNNNKGCGNYHYETTVTTIDENGKVTSTTTNNNNNNDESRGFFSGLKSKTTETNNKNKNNNNNSNPRPLLLERGFGDFERCFTFPQRIVKDSATAAMSEGVLSLSIEKVYKEGSGTRTVDIR